MHGIPFTIAGLTLALAVYVWAVLKVGQARGRYGVAAPATTGAPEFERAFRAQQNTVEQMVLFLPLLALVSFLWSDSKAGLYALIWSTGRILYIETYSRGMNRSLGFMLSAGISLAMLIAVVIKLAVTAVGIG